MERENVHVCAYVCVCVCMGAWMFVRVRAWVRDSERERQRSHIMWAHFVSEDWWLRIKPENIGPAAGHLRKFETSFCSKKCLVGILIWAIQIVRKDFPERKSGFQFLFYDAKPFQNWLSCLSVTFIFVCLPIGYLYNFIYLSLLLDCCVNAPFTDK